MSIFDPIDIGDRLDLQHDILCELRHRWAAHPEQRLGQFLLNLVRDHGTWPDVWEVRDEVWLEKLRAAK